MKKNKRKVNTGTAILETLFYISLFAAISIAVIDSLVVMTKSFKETNTQISLAQGQKIIERIANETRQASEITSITPTNLRLNTTDQTGNIILGFNLNNGNIELLKNDVVVDNLNSGNLTVTNLSFTNINTTIGKAVKIDLSVVSKFDSQNREENFHNTAVLRGKY